MCIAGGRIDPTKHINFGKIEDARSAQSKQLKQVKAHEHLFYEGDDRNCIYVVESGWVKLYRTLIDGQRQVVGFANAGSILGLECDDTHVNGCETITPVTIRAIAGKSLRDICQHEPQLAEQLLRQVGRQLGAAQAQLAAVGAQSAEQKLASFLLSVADLCDATLGGDFDLPMRRGDMAEFLGLRLETVSRKMSEFQRRGWIQMTSLYHCRISRRHMLQELAEGGETAPAPIPPRTRSTTAGLAA
ncbi:MAG: Crp/Fnr family transcriptional regulator [Hyphomonadaceae bacterium]